MNYIYVDNNMIEVPKIVDVNGIPKLECQVNCVSGVEGDTYGFQKNDFLTLYVDVNLTIPQVKENLALQCTNFIHTNYPNTN
jgi:hypothetical protein